MKHSDYPWLANDAFKTEGGKYITESMFYETQQYNHPNPELTRWSMTEFDKERDGKVYPSAYRVIVEAADEYDAAMKICGSWPLWNRMKDNKTIWNGKQGVTMGLARALEEQRVRKASLAGKQLHTAAMDGNVAAQKFIFDLNKEKNQKKKSSVKKDDGAEYDKVVHLLNKIKA
jgi:hypothetical protein